MTVEQETKSARSGCRWTSDELHYLSDNYGLLLDETIARNLDRSVHGITETAVRRLNGRRHRDGFYTTNELAKTLGLADGRKIIGWVERGWLKARKGPMRQGRNRIWTFRERSIVRCLRQRPWLVDLASMPEHYFRFVVRREWERDSWHTIKELRTLLGSENTILRYIHRRWLAAEKKPFSIPNGGAWVIRDSAVKAFLKDDPRPSSRHKAISESQRNLLLESGRASKLAMVWQVKCPSCGQRVRVIAPPQLYGPQVREKFINLYVNGNCAHSSYCRVSLNGNQQKDTHYEQQKLEHLAQRRQ